DGLVDDELRWTVLALVARLNVAAELQCHQMLAVADPQGREPQRENGGIALRRVFAVDGVGTSAEDDGARRRLANGVDAGSARDDFTVHLALAHPTGNELRVLRAVVENQNALS